jgi:hypothetical protein
MVDCGLTPQLVER